MLSELSKVVDVIICVSIISYFIHVLHITLAKKKKLTRLCVDSRCTVLMFSNIFFKGKPITNFHICFAGLVILIWGTMIALEPGQIHLVWSLATTSVTLMPLLLIRHKYS